MQKVATQFVMNETSEYRVKLIAISYAAFGNN